MLKLPQFNWQLLSQPQLQLSASASTDTPKPTSSSVPATVSLASVSQLLVSATSGSCYYLFFNLCFYFFTASSVASLLPLRFFISCFFCLDFNSNWCILLLNLMQMLSSVYLHTIVTVNPNIANCFALFFILIRPPY